MLPLLSLLASTVPTGAGEAPPATPRRLSVAYYGAPNSNVSAADAAFFKSVGVTDAWTPYLAGAWPVDCCDCRRPGHESKSCTTDAKGGAAVYAKEGLHGGLVSLQQAKDEGLVETYQAAGINTWFFERPVPDFQWTHSAGTIGKGLWNNSEQIDAGWEALAANISTVYPQVKDMGFAGGPGLRQRGLLLRDLQGSGPRLMPLARAQRFRQDGGRQAGPRQLLQARQAGRCGHRRRLAQRAGDHGLRLPLPRLGPVGAGAHRCWRPRADRHGAHLVSGAGPCSCAVPLLSVLRAAVALAPAPGRTTQARGTNARSKTRPDPTTSLRFWIRRRSNGHRPTRWARA